MDSWLLSDDERDLGVSQTGLWGSMVCCWKWLKGFCIDFMVRFGYSDEERLKKLQELRAELESELAYYKEGRAPGASVAFVMFRDVYTTNKDVQDFQNEKRMRIGKFFSVMELRLRRNQWKVKRTRSFCLSNYWKLSCSQTNI
ncbi:hypothetical protein DEO72_LG3g1479 [Vigna unguiculata]|uniref:Uncharacterized protein n=1 Tax=Vigna unguiculata TaxID=3917 RepID=A0A4D6LEK5_VIGUN|nr:hypothetical protein DEO72_LG3g1479 [Vigna unguiculata]